MATEAEKKEQSEAKETREITFECKYCGKNRPLSDMRTSTRFFPRIMACRDCIEKMR
jgi:hypothetical protein